MATYHVGIYIKTVFFTSCSASMLHGSGYTLLHRLYTEVMSHKVLQTLNIHALKNIKIRMYTKNNT